EVNLILGPEGINQQQGSAKIWRLRSADENWSISVSATFLALESRQYPGRTELRSRLSFAIERFLQFARPPFLERVGVRYINRVHDEDIVRNLSKYVKPEVLGPLAAPIPSSVSVNHSINETRYVVDDQELQVRQGFVGPGLLHDPAIAPVKYPTWILDLDAFTHVKREFSAESVDRLVGELAARDYRYFRWAVTAEFLERFGGEHVS
ncbi:TIGR04255 family protein, partial [Microbispora bryophytorum]